MSMERLRRGDPNTAGHFKRSERIIAKPEGFYYCARGGKQFGPFSTRSMALFDLNSYLEVASLREQLNDEVFDIAV